jgi:hypothetical protein
MVDLDRPIVPAPGGYVVDLEHPQRRGEAIITWVGIAGMAIATLLLVVRAYTKIVLVKKLSSDDCKSLSHTSRTLANNPMRVPHACMGEYSQLLNLQTRVADRLMADLLHTCTVSHYL